MPQKEAMSKTEMAKNRLDSFKEKMRRVQSVPTAKKPKKQPMNNPEWRQEPQHNLELDRA